MSTRSPRPRSRPAEILVGLGSLIALAAMTIGYPIAMLVATRILAPGLPSPSHISDLIHRDNTNMLLLAMLAAGWLAWAMFTLALLVEIPAAIRGIRAPRLPALGGMQRTAATLLAAIAAILPAAGTAMAAEPGGAPNIAAVRPATVATASAHAGTLDTSAHTRSTTDTRSYTVADRDTLWSIAEHQLGDGARWRDVAALNDGRIMRGGVVFSAKEPIQPGWVLLLPHQPGTSDHPASIQSDHAGTSPHTAPTQRHDTPETTHLVKPGDTLSGIAQEDYGDANLWPTIFAANKGADQNGQPFENPDLIFPGDHFKIPHLPGATASDPGQNQTKPQVTTQPGTPTTAPTSSATTPAPPAATTTTAPSSAASASAPPTVPSTAEGLLPGQFPATTAATTPSSASSNPASASSSSSPSSPSSTAGPQTTDGATSAAPTSAPTTAPTSSPGAPTRTPAAQAPSGTTAQAAGPVASQPAAASRSTAPILVPATIATGVIAGGFCLLLLRKRKVQQQRRPIGQRIAMPKGPTAALDELFTAAADQQIIDELDSALATLAQAMASRGEPLPPLAAVILRSDGVELRLQEPPTASPPGPFQLLGGDSTCWFCPTGSTTSAKVRRAAYPGLVTLGRLADGSTVLIDLEQIGVVEFAGTPEQTEPVLRNIAVALFTTPLADHVDLIVSETASELAATAAEPHLRSLALPAAIDDLEAWRTQTLPLLDANPDALRRARAAGDRGDLNIPHILLAGHHAGLDPDTAERLDALHTAEPRSAHAAVVAVPRSAPSTSAGWRLSIDPVGQVVLPDLDLTVRLDVCSDERYREILELLAVTDDDPEDAAESWVVPLATFTVSQQDISLGDLLPGSPAPGPTEIPTKLFTQTTPTPSPPPAPPAPPASPAPAAPPRPEDLVTVVDAATFDFAGDWAATPTGPPPSEAPPLITTPDVPTTTAPAAEPPALPGPRIHILGQVELLGFGAETPAPLAVEVAAYLAAHPGTTKADLISHVWPGQPDAAAVADVQLNRLRTMLGTDAQGNLRLPLPDADGALAFSGDIECDWTDFIRLIAAGDLVNALLLIRGEPLDRTPPRRYAWAPALREEISSAVIDVAHVLAQAYLEAGDPDSAARAAGRGLIGVPYSEVLHCDLMRALHAQGDTAELERIVDRVLAICDAFGTSPLPATKALIEELFAPTPVGVPRTL